MLAPLAHHLCAPGVPLNGHPAHGAGLDLPVELVQAEEVGDGLLPTNTLLLGPHDQLLAVLGAGLVGVVVARAEGAELLVAARAHDGVGVVGGVAAAVVADVADGVAVRGRAPRAVLVQAHLCKGELKETVSVIFYIAEGRF